MPPWLGLLVYVAGRAVLSIWALSIIRNRIWLVVVALSGANAVGNLSNAVFYPEGVVDFVCFGGMCHNIADFAGYASTAIAVGWVVLWLLDRVAAALRKADETRLSRWLFCRI